MTKLVKTSMRTKAMRWIMTNSAVISIRQPVNSLTVTYSDHSNFALNE